MPKEITHWILADRVRKSVSYQSVFKGPLYQFSNVYLTGAVIPDSPYTCVIGPSAKAIQTLSHPLHGIDGSSLIPVLSFMEHFGPDHPQAMAFAAGIITHIMADTAFHPLIGYFSGMEGVHEGARARHRMFETGLDEFFVGRGTGRDQYPVSLIGLVNGLEIKKQMLGDFICGLFMGKTGTDHSAVRTVLACHMVLQYLFRSKCAYLLFHTLHQKKAFIPASIDTLFYPADKQVNPEFFKRSFSYTDPFSGDSVRASVDELADKSVESALRVLDIIDSVIREKAPLAAVITHPGLPLIRPGYSKQNFNAWINKDDPLSDMYTGMTPGGRHKLNY